MARYGRGPAIGGAGQENARDMAVRAANIQAGFGNSTALRTLQQNAVGGGVKPEQIQPARRGSAAGKPGGPKTSSTGPSIGVKPNLIEGDPANVTSPSGAGGFYQTQGMQTPTGAPGFYTGADPGSTVSPTSVAQPARGPTTEPNSPIPSDLNWDQHGFHRGPWGQPPASVGFGMQPKFPYDMPSPSNVPPSNVGVGMPNASIGLGMQPKTPYAMPSPSNVPPHGSLLPLPYSSGVGRTIASPGFGPPTISLW
jgi:hypothetical protein